MSLRYPGGLITKSPTAPTTSAAPGIWTLEQALQYIKAGTWPLSVLGDPYFGYNTLLLPGQGTNGANNKTFLDSGTANGGVPFTVVTNGTPTQGTFTPFSEAPGYWSNYFGTAAHFLSVANNAALNLSGGAYTIEGWVYPNANYTSYNVLVAKRVAGGSASSAWELFLDAGTGVLAFYNGTVYASAVTPPPNQWSHFAGVYDGTSLSLYLNGYRVLGPTAVSNTDYSADPVIGSYLTTSSNYEQLFGYLSNVRITKGAALYTGSTYTVPTGPLTTTVSSGTVSLLTCQSNRYIDNSVNAAVITATGLPSVQTFQPFGAPTSAYSAATIGGSGYFDGSGDYLTVTANNAFNFGTGDFTVEGWIYPTRSGLNAIWTNGPASSGSFGVGINASNKLQMDYYLGTSLAGATSVQLYAWNYFAFVRSGSNLYVYLNGVRDASTTTSSNNSTNSFALGRFWTNDATNEALGYISNFRITDASARYTSATMTVPTAPLTNDASTSLLLNFTNTGVLDNAVSNDLVTVDNASISTAQFKWGTSSISLDGTGDYLFAPTSQNIAFGTGDFTWEAWIYVTTVGAGDKPIYESRSTNSNTDGFTVTAFSSTVIRVYTNTVVVTATVPDYLNTWTHVAFVRAAGFCKLYVNGNQCASAAFTSNLTNTTAAVGAGRYGSTNLDTYLTGYIADLRLTKGYARYLYSFTPPTAAFPLFYQAAPTPTTDPYFDYTTLLLAGNQPSGVTDTNNNVFKDSSANNFTITRNPASGPNAPTQGTFTPFSKVDGRWGNYFDGSGDILSAASNAAFALGTGDFTVETFAYYAAQSNVDAIAVANWDGGTWGSNKWSLHLDHTSYRAKVTFWFHNYSSSAPLLISTTTLAIGQWYHVAVSRSGNTFRLFINGILDVSATNSTSLDGGTNSPIYVGGGVGGAGSQYFNGYLSSTRLVKGTAVYTASFTTPTSPLTNISGTSLLTCQSNRFRDNSTNAFALTVSGNPSVQTFSPFPTTASYDASVNGGSGYFDGTGDYVQTPSNAAFGFGTGDFHISFWAYLLSDANKTFFGNVTDNLNLYVAASTKYIGLYTGTTNDSTTLAPLNQWAFFVITRTGSTLQVYLNNTSILSISNSTNFATTSYIIGNNNGTSNINAYISNFKIVKGVAWTPAANPTAPLTSDANTSLLLNYTNGGIIDNTMSNDLETVGNASISTTQSKFGGSSMYFDGTGDWLLAKASNVLSFETGDFTIEGWLYPTAVTGADRCLWDTRAVSTDSGMVLFIDTNGKLATYTSSALRLTSGASLSANTWTHFALVRYSGTMAFYINGFQSGTVAYSTTITCPGTVFIGARQDSAAPYTGYIDDLRITKGIARYVQNFTPPTSAFLTL
jgi:hypothetical protein